MDSPTTRLRAALDQPPGATAISRTDLAEVLRLAELVQRLRAYAVHRPECRYYTERRPYGGDLTIPGACSCGLNDVLQGRFAGESDPSTMRGRAERGR